MGSHMPEARLPKAVLLDLDDTIIDDSGGVEAAWTLACVEAAAEHRGLDAEKLRSAVFQVRDWYWLDPERARAGRHDLRAASASIVEQALAGLGLRHASLAARVANRYRDLREETAGLLPGAVEALDRLRGMGLRLALLTNGSAAGQRAKIDRFQLTARFDFICIEGEFGFGKPDERVYHAALEALDCRPAAAWMAGDNLEWDVGAPMRLGMYGIWVDRLHTGLPEGDGVRPDRIVHSIAELP
jgi:putative hydrolase of the HAD superfamily